MFFKITLGGYQPYLTLPLEPKVLNFGVKV